MGADSSDRHPRSISSAHLAGRLAVSHHHVPTGREAHTFSNVRHWEGLSPWCRGRPLQQRPLRSLSRAGLVGPEHTTAHCSSGWVMQRLGGGVGSQAEGPHQLSQHRWLGGSSLGLGHPHLAAFGGWGLVGQHPDGVTAGWWFLQLIPGWWELVGRAHSLASIPGSAAAAITIQPSSEQLSRRVGCWLHSAEAHAWDQWPVALICPWQHHPHTGHSLVSRRWRGSNPHGLLLPC